MKVDVLFLSFFARNDNISFGWNFVREELEKSLMDSSDSEEFGFVGKS